MRVKGWSSMWFKLRILSLTHIFRLTEQYWGLLLLISILLISSFLSVVVSLDLKIKLPNIKMMARINTALFISLFID